MDLSSVFGKKKVADLLGEEDIYTFIIAKSGRVMNEIFKI